MNSAEKHVRTQTQKKCVLLFIIHEAEMHFLCSSTAIIYLRVLIIFNNDCALDQK